MKAIVIKRPLTDTESVAILGKIKTGGYAMFADVSLPGRLQSFTQGNYDISEEEKKRINYETMDFVISFGDKVIGGKAVVDWLGFEDSSIWYYHKFRTYFRLRKLKYEQAEVSSLAEEYGEVEYYTAEPFLQKTKVPDKVSLIMSDTEARAKRNYYSLIPYLVILLSRFLLNIFSHRKLRKPDHIIMDVTKRQAFLDINTLKVCKGNYVIGYLLEKAGKDFLIIDEAVQPKLSGGAKISLSRDNLFGKGSWKNRFYGEPLILKYFLSAGLRKKKKKLLSNIKAALNKLGELCTEEDEKLLCDIYRSYTGATNFYLIKYLAYQKLFRKHAFKTITTVDENSPARKAILDAARSSGIKTIAVQHGNIYDLHPSYLFTKNDKLAGIMPDITLVWGNYYKDFLVQKANYPLKNIISTGQVRTDIIPSLLNANIPKEKVIPGISKHHQIITFASQPQHDQQLREQSALDVMNATKEIPDAFLVIKLHPNELKDVNYYEAIAKKSGITKYAITYHIDLYLLLSISSVVITCFSTVGSEAVYFNKALIIIDYQKQDLLNYIRLGIAHPAYNKADLENNIKNIITGKLNIDKRAYENFVRQFAYKIDGKVVSRVLNSIREIEND